MATLKNFCIYPPYGMVAIWDHLVVLRFCPSLPAFSLSCPTILDLSTINLPLTTYNNQPFAHSLTRLLTPSLLAPHGILMVSSYCCTILEPSPSSSGVYISPGLHISARKDKRLRYRGHELIVEIARGQKFEVERVSLWGWEDERLRVRGRELMIGIAREWAFEVRRQDCKKDNTMRWSSSTTKIWWLSRIQ